MRKRFGPSDPASDPRVGDDAGTPQDLAPPGDDDALAQVEEHLREDLDALFSSEAVERFGEHEGQGGGLVDVQEMGLLTLVTVCCPSLRERQMARIFEELRAQTAQHPERTRYALSLGLVQQIGVAVLPQLLEMDAWFRRGGRRLVLFDCPPPWRRLLRASRLDRQLSIAGNFRAARRMLKV